ncbi:MAG TPA: enterotoxin [Paraburkholderia sp.]|nr:enterotoxin [Paraburkholderia sp.]
MPAYSPALASPGAPSHEAHGATHVFGNAACALGWTTAPQPLGDVRLFDRIHGRTLPLHTPLRLRFADGSTLGSDALTPDGPSHVEPLPADATAPRVAQRFPGTRVSAAYVDTHRRLRIEWSVEQRIDAQYLRIGVALTALTQDLPIVTITLCETTTQDAHASGTLDGVPLVVGQMYVGFELPQAHATVHGDLLSLNASRTLPLERGKTVVYSMVAGVAREGQLRRDFAAYLERERAHPPRPFLHYNSWYDIGFLSRYTEAQALERIGTIGRELCERRGVTLDSFLFDDGWDDYSGGWRFSSDLPRGFAPLAEAAARVRAAPGAWLSPWGGYCGPRDERVARGAAAGFETIDGGLALSGPRYFERFRAVVFDLLARHGINHFKFDGTGNANRVVPGSRFDSDWHAAIELIGAMRGVRRDVFVNLSTGTLPSPFWLLHVDTIWRGGADTGFAGAGSARERWITYRDAQTYRNVVLASPLFPLNSLMLHGIVCAQHNGPLADGSSADFVNEARSYFASGTQLQELYVTPALLGEAAWDALAAAARWARGHAGVLNDNHWIGGAPDEEQVYGWAAWTPDLAIVTLRNPANEARDFTLQLRAQLELPRHAAPRFAVQDVWQNGNASVPLTMDADAAQCVRLAAFEVLTLQLVPGS